MKKKRLFALMLAAGLAFTSLNTVKAEDISKHTNTEGTNFLPEYSYDNPFKGSDLKDGATFSFHVKSLGAVHTLGTIFALTETGSDEGRLYFTPGSYLGYNSANHGGFFDANLNNYTLVKDYLGQEADVRITFVPTGFEVYVNDTLAYDQTILDDSSAAGGDFNSGSDFSAILDFIANADTLTFGYGSWWNASNADEANIDLTDFVCSLADGTELERYFSGSGSTTPSSSNDGKTDLSTVQPNQPSGYTALYKFNNSLRNEVTGNSGSLVGSSYIAAPSKETPDYSEGISGKALRLNGTDGVKLETVPKSSNYTVSFSIKLDDNPSKHTPMVFFCNLNEDGTVKGENTDAQWLNISALGWQETIADGPMIWSRNVPDGAVWNDVYKTGNNLFQTQKWQVITMTGEGTIGKIYVDGTLVAEGPVANIMSSSSNTAGYIGVNAWDMVLKASIDDLYIYDKVLSETEIAELAAYSLSARTESDDTTTPTPAPTQAAPSQAAQQGNSQSTSSSTEFPMVAVVLIVAAVAIVIVAIIVVKRKR